MIYLVPGGYNGAMQANSLKALIFDVDGTLVDNEHSGHRVAFNRAFKDNGLDWHWNHPTYDKLLEVFGGKERIRYYIEDFLEEFNCPEGVDAFIARIHKRKTEHYLELLGSGALPLRPGVARLLREAHAEGLKLAIASSTTLENAHLLISSSLGEAALDWFDVYACGDVVANKKPAADIYLYTLEKLGLSASQCLVFEDTEAGLEAAAAAGIATIITINDATRGQDFTGAALVVDQMGEPGDGFELLAGNSFGENMVTVNLLRRIHSGMNAS
jgi:HAD superfamily hydrolase (TIGR01509 family)